MLANAMFGLEQRALQCLYQEGGSASRVSDGEGGIRTLERGQPPLRDFQSRPFSRSGTSPSALPALETAYRPLQCAVSVRALFFNEGNLDTHVLGHGQLDAAVRAGLAGAEALAVRFAGLPPLTGGAHALAHRRIRLLRKGDLDFVVLRWHLVQSIRARRALRTELARWPADVVHLYTPAVALTMADLMRTTPVVLSTGATIHDWWAMPAWRRTQPHAELTIAASRMLERRALRRAALVLARTGWARRATEQEAPGVRVLEHHPGIDLERYQPAEQRPRERPRVLFVGSRFAQKGGEDLLAALDDLLGVELDLDVVTPVAVPERAGVRVHRLAREDPRLLDLQQQADVACLPTWGDTNPWTITESLACGTPIVSTRIGGIPDMLAGGEAGVLVDHGDRRALRQALLALVRDPDRRRQLSAAARRRAEAHYDARRQFALLVGHLCEAVALHRERTRRGPELRRHATESAA
jgi:glycosyltransferase involved in cell wall biosynthesis